MESILNFHRVLLEEFGKETTLSQGKIGGIFLKYADFLKLYTIYCLNQSKANETIDRLSKTRDFNVLLDEAKRSPMSRGLKLDGYVNSLDIFYFAKINY